MPICAKIRSKDKIALLFPTASIVDKRLNFQYGRRNSENAITLQGSSYHKTHLAQYCVVRRNV